MSYETWKAKRDKEKTELTFRKAFNAGLEEGRNETTLIVNKETQKQIKELETLLKRAADSLQEFTSELDGDMNNALAMEIYETLGL